MPSAIDTATPGAPAPDSASTKQRLARKRLGQALRLAILFAVLAFGVAATAEWFWFHHTDTRPLILAFDRGSFDELMRHAEDPEKLRHLANAILRAHEEMARSGNGAIDRTVHLAAIAVASAGAALAVVAGLLVSVRRAGRAPPA